MKPFILTSTIKIKHDTTWQASNLSQMQRTPRKVYCPIRTRLFICTDGETAVMTEIEDYLKPVDR